MNEWFVTGGGGGSGSVDSQLAFRFPEPLPEAREIEAAVRGTPDTVTQVRDSA